MKLAHFFWKMKPFDLLFMLDLESPWNDVVFRLTYPKPKATDVFGFESREHMHDICFRYIWLHCIDLYSILLYYILLLLYIYIYF